MYVSTYNTYVDPGRLGKADTKKVTSTASKNTTFFEFQTLQSDTLQNALSLPINYLSRYKVISNKQKLYEQQNGTYEKADTKFKKISTFKNAKVAYDENILNFKITYEPKKALNILDRVNTNINALKTQAINIYIDNDNYYKATA